jgi:plastocyanin
MGQWRVRGIWLGIMFTAACMSGCTSGEGVGKDNYFPDPGGPAGAIGHENRTVALHDDYFASGNITIETGTTVEYVNKGTHNHTVTIHRASEAPTSLRLNQTLAPGESVDYLFAEKGTYDVWCAFHGTMTSGMASSVTVQ